MEKKSVPEILQEVKEMDIVTYLANLGIVPAKRPVNDKYLFLSPFRDEKDPSFKVDRGLNSWYDHGAGLGGNLVDLMIKLHNWTIGDVLRWTRNHTSIVLAEKRPGFARTETEVGIEILKVQPLTSKALFNYLLQRKIDLDVADHFSRQITYKIGEKIFFGIGLKNDEGGWAIRTPFMKSASYPNGSTSIKNGSPNVVVQEGQFEFLSYQTIFKNLPEANYDFLVLNSVNNIESSLPKMTGYQQGYVLLNNDNAGQDVTDIILKRYPHFLDKRSMFATYNDLNDWHRNFGRHEKPVQRYTRSRVHLP